MIGIKMSNCKFYVDEGARTIVCVIPNTSKMVTDFIRENFVFSDINFYDSIDYWSSMPFANKLLMPSSFMGKAVCTEDDEWNEELGRMIAFSRAKDKCYKSFFKRANLFIQTIDERLGNMIEKFNDFGLKLEAKREALQDTIDKRVYPDKEKEEEYIDKE